MRLCAQRCTVAWQLNTRSIWSPSERRTQVIITCAQVSPTAAEDASHLLSLTNNTSHWGDTLEEQLAWIQLSNHTDNTWRGMMVVKAGGVKTKHLNSVSLRFLYWRTFFRGSSGQVLYDQSAHSTKASSGWHCWQVCPKKKKDEN